MDDDQEHKGHKSCCSCCFSFIITAGLSALFIWLSLRADKPKCSIQYFYIPALNKTLNSQSNTSLNFMIRLDNPNKDKGIYYDDVHLSFFTKNNSSALLPIGNYTVPSFYQGHQKKGKKWGHFEPLMKKNQTILGAVLGNGSAYFRVDLKTQVRYKIVLWKTKRDRIEVGGDVEVKEGGDIVNKKEIKMKKSDSVKTLMAFDFCFFTSLLLNLVVFFSVL